MILNEHLSPRLTLQLYDELYIVDLNHTLYFMADDHYTHVYYDMGIHFVVPFGLSKIVEKLIEQRSDQPLPFMRLGRSHVVNLSKIFHINTAKQQLVLTGQNGKTTVLHISKPVLRQLMTLLSEERS